MTPRLTPHPGPLPQGERGISRNALRTLKRDIVFEACLRGFDLVFHSTWGLFSPRNLDDGTRLLIETMDVRDGDTCLDLGCGYGPIGLVMARLSRTGDVTMVDKDFVAVEYARKNVERNRVANCKVLLSNAFSHLPKMRFDVIASNLPANVGSELLRIILLDARDHLKPDGRLYVVTIAGLRDYIRRHFEALFGNYEKVKQRNGYSIALAVKGRSTDLHA